MEGITDIADVTENDNFTRISSEHSTDSMHICTLEDFRLTEGSHAGEITDLQLFRCDITSAMDPDKSFTTKIYVSVPNTLPSPDSCKVVTGLEATPDTMGVYVSWTRSNYNQRWQLVYGPADDDPETYTTTYTNTEDFIICEIPRGVKYAVRVHANCFNTSTFSEWCDTVQFMRPELPPQSIDDTQQSFTTLAPNPAHDKVTITSAFDLRRITLYDLQGHAALDIDAEGLTATLDIRSLPAGSYVAAVLTRQGLNTHKLIINK